MRSRLLLPLLLGFAPLLARGEDRATEIVRVHIAAIGGAEQIAALSAVRATGHVIEGDQTIPFVMIAQRPNRVRMEYSYPEGTLIEATDGIHPPWKLDRRQAHARAVVMDENEGQAFSADSDFDDPLVNAGHGTTVESAGQAYVNGHTTLRLLVTRRLSSSFFLFIDPTTYFIVRRIDPKPAVGVDTADITTDYSNFLPVNGVLTAYQTTISENGKVIQRATVDTYEANPTLPKGVFEKPTQ